MSPIKSKRRRRITKIVNQINVCRAILVPRLNPPLLRRFIAPKTSIPARSSLVPTSTPWVPAWPESGADTHSEERALTPKQGQKVSTFGPRLRAYVDDMKPSELWQLQYTVNKIFTGNVDVQFLKQTTRFPELGKAQSFPLDRSNLSCSQIRKHPPNFGCGLFQYSECRFHPDNFFKLLKRSRARYAVCKTQHFKIWTLSCKSNRFDGVLSVSLHCQNLNVTAGNLVRLHDMARKQMTGVMHLWNKIAVAVSINQAVRQIRSASRRGRVCRAPP